MTEDQLQAIARQYEKAKLGGSGPQALADWAAQHASTLLAHAQMSKQLEMTERSHIDALAKLYPNVPIGASIIAHAADDIRALRADRAKRAGTAQESETLSKYAEALSDFAEALRPFAALASPPALEALEAAANAHGLAWDQGVVHVADQDGMCVVRVTLDQAKRAQELVNEFDGCGA